MADSNIGEADLHRGALGAARQERHASRIEPLQRAVLAASAHLLGAGEGAAFVPAVRRALGVVGRAAGMHRVMLIEHVGDDGGPGDVWWQVAAEWHAPDVPEQGATPQARGRLADAPDWAARVGGHDPVVDARTEDLRDAGFRAVQEALGARYVLAAKIRLDGCVWGALVLDDCRTARRRSAAERTLLASAAQAFGLAVHRHRTRERAELQREAVRSRRDTLLGAVADAAEALTRTPDLATALAEAARVLGDATGVDRVNVFRYDHATSAAHFHAEWARPGITPASAVDPGPFTHAEYAEVFVPTMAGAVYHSPLATKIGANAALNLAAGVHTDLFVPVFVDGAFWGLLNLDDCTSERAWTDGEVEVLRAGAAVVAAAVQRARRESAHAEALAAERARMAEARAAELGRANAALQTRDALLTAVVGALDALLGADDFEVAIVDALGQLGTAAGLHRVKVLLARAAPDGEPHHELAYEWWAAGFASQASHGLVRFRDADVAWYVTEMRAGRSVWHTIDEPAMPETLRAAFARVGMHSMGVVPIFAGAEYAGMVAFDDCVETRPWSQPEVDALGAAARAIGTAILRRELAHQAARLERQLLTERQESAERRAVELAGRNALLSTAVDASRVLIDAVDLGAACDRVLAALGPALQVDRAALGVLTPANDGGTPWCELAHEWTAPGVARQSDDPALRRTRLAGSHAQMASFLAGEPIQGTIDEFPVPQREEQAAAGVRAAFAVPVLVDGVAWGVLGFDDVRRTRRWDVEEIGFLRIVGAALAAAVHRQRAERERAEAVAEERTRAAELRASELGVSNAHLAKRLQLVRAAVDTADTLLAVPSVNEALPIVLQQLGHVLGADRVAVTRIEPPDADSRLGWIVVEHEWTAVGIPRQSDDPALARMNADGYGDVVEALRHERVVQVRTDDLPARGRAEQTAAQVRSQVVVTVHVQGELFGFLGFDDCTVGRVWDEAEVGLLRVVASSIGSAYEREALSAARTSAERAVLMEREQAAEARASALAEEVARRSHAEQVAAGQAAVLTRAVARLADADLDPGRGPATTAGVRDALLLAVVEQLGAARVDLWTVDAARDRCELAVTCHADGRLQTAGDQPEHPGARPFTFSAAEGVASHAVFESGACFDVGPAYDHPSHAPFRVWMDQVGVRSALMTPLRLRGELRAVFFVGFADERTASSAEGDLATAVGHLLALAAEAERLAEAARSQAREAAALGERNRLARELHDTVAQGLAGIVMQLKAARRRLGESTWAANAALSLAERLAQEHLAAARRAITVLRPGAETDALDVVLHRAASEAAAQTSAAVRVDVVGSVRALPAEVAFECGRVVQAALANAVQHADARSVVVTLEYGAHVADGIRIIVCDDGRGFDPASVPSGHFGLVGMRERADRVGAELTLLAAPGEGTRVLLRWPASPALP